MYLSIWRFDQCKHTPSTSFVALCRPSFLYIWTDNHNWLMTGSFFYIQSPILRFNFNQHGKKGWQNGHHLVWRGDQLKKEKRLCVLNNKQKSIIHSLLPHWHLSWLNRVAYNSTSNPTWNSKVTSISQVAVDVLNVWLCKRPHLAKTRLHDCALSWYCCVHEKDSAQKIEWYNIIPAYFV